MLRNICLFVIHIFIYMWWYEKHSYWKIPLPIMEYLRCLVQYTRSVVPALCNGYKPNRWILSPRCSLSYKIFQNEMAWNGVGVLCIPTVYTAVPTLHDILLLSTGIKSIRPEPPPPPPHSPSIPHSTPIAFYMARPGPMRHHIKRHWD